MNYPFVHRIKVRSHDLDSFGHVNNAVYLNYLEEARCEYMEQRGISFTDFAKWQAFAFVVSAEIKYKSPAKYGDVLEIRGVTSSTKRSTFSIDYEIFNITTDKLGAVSNMSFAFVNGNEKIIPIPAPFRENML
jgi:acyl-CoA thioester hydrolase